MARPRVFVSSTYFDLRQVRADLERFVTDLGYDIVLHERGTIPYGSKEKLEKYCYREIQNVDILVSIIGGRYGSQSSVNPYSISQLELKTALDQNKQIYIFIDKNVYAEYRTYLNNKDNKEIVYSHVDNIRIFEFIDELYGLPTNNAIAHFESAQDIVVYLREQWAGLFQQLLQEQRREPETRSIDRLQSTAKTLDQLVNYLTEDRKKGDSAIRDVILANHPAFQRLRDLTRTKYRIFFFTHQEMADWLKSKGYSRIDDVMWDDPDVEEWIINIGNRNHVLYIDRQLFGADGKLKPMDAGDWSDNFIRSDTIVVAEETDDDIPF